VKKLKGPKMKEPKEPKDITPDGSKSKVYLDETPIVDADCPPPPMDDEALRDEAVQKLIDDFGFTEAMARAVVGT
jgi:hypothetical protein